MDLPVINFKNGSRIETINYGTAHRSSRADNNGELWFEIKRRIAEPDQFDNRNFDLFRREYEEVQEMRVLFVRPEVYDTVCNWYEGMADVQKNRKITVICKSVEDFWQQFDALKFGASYTTFYFDDMLSLSETFNIFKGFVPLYGDIDAKYISENKMRRISIDYLMNNNRFDIFQSFSIDPDCIDDAIKNAWLEQTECVCYSLL